MIQVKAHLSRTNSYGAPFVNGTRHSVTAAFEHALSPSSASSASPGLWKLYLLFSIYGFRNGDGDAGEGSLISKNQNI